MKSLDNYWYSQNPVAWLLLPVSLLYCALVFVRRVLYKFKMLQSYKISVPVIIVGNITVGGTGKTPLIIELCHLLKNAGYKPGVISRGYGGSYTQLTEVATDADPVVVGDEPLLIAKNSQCPVIVCKNKVLAAQVIVDKHDCDIVLSDDGLQHYRLQRDIEICIVDSARKHGNGFCLPAGPLRETKSRLKNIDFVVFNGDLDQGYNFIMNINNIVNIKTGEQKKISDLSESKIHAIAGIGNPERFFDQLKKHGLKFAEHKFSDHHYYTESDLAFVDSSAVVMTEKDAIKCCAMLNADLWYAPTTIALSSKFQKAIMSQIQELTNG